MRRTSFSRFPSALILAGLLALPLATTTAIPAYADGPAFGSGAGLAEGAEEDDGGYLGSGHREGGLMGSGSKSSGYLGSGNKDGGTIVTSGGLRAWTLQLRNLARLALLRWAGV